MSLLARMHELHHAPRWSSMEIDDMMEDFFGPACPCRTEEHISSTYRISQIDHRHLYTVNL
jgi:hypothetical protein